MITMLNGWKGCININGQDYNTISDVTMPLNGPIRILLKQEHKEVESRQETNEIKGDKEYLITVKKYMTEEATPQFDFMAKWNNNKPMPLRTMVGTVDKETRGMIHMKLHGDIYAEKICTCMRCGRKLTNPVSQYIGLGPECGSFVHATLDLVTKEEIMAEAERCKMELRKVEWEGWIIKSAIVEQEEI